MAGEEDDSDSHNLMNGDGSKADDGDPTSKARKRKERLEQNRISARESRKRKKTMIEELQRTVITLSRENKELNERNEHLRRQLMEIGSKYPNIVPLQAIVDQASNNAANQGVDPNQGGQPNVDMAAAAAAAAAQQQAQATTASVMATFNPMAWLQGQGVPGQQPTQGAPGNQANV